MLEIVSSAKPYLEALYFLAGILLIGGLGLTYRQVVLIKKDIRTRNERAAAEKAIEACDRYFCSYVPLNGTFFHDRLKEKIGGYEGPIGDFSLSSIPDNLKDISLKRYALHSWLPMMNQLESISAFFMSGIADECTGFRVIGRTFCGSVESSYDLISISRQEKACPYWANTVDLYQLWRPRLTKAEMEIAKENIEHELSSISARTISPIGVAG